MYLRCLLIFCFFVSVAQQIAAQTYEGKVVRVIIPTAPGSSVDLLGRAVAQKLEEKTGGSFLAINHPGANGMIGGEIAAKALPNGYTLLVGSTTSITANPHMYLKMAYDSLNDLVPVVQIATSAYVLVSHPSVPAKTVRELIELARKNPKLITFGSAGVGSGQHLSGELFSKMAKVEMLHVPYTSTAPAIKDLLGGHINILFNTSQVVKSLVATGRLRVIAVTGIARNSVFPDTPTISEAGLRGYEMNNWHGMFVPKATSPIIVEYLNKAVHVILAAPEMKESWRNDGVEFIPNTPAQFAAIVRGDYERLGKLIQAIGIKPE